MDLPLFRKAQFNNLLRSSKKSATVSVRLIHSSQDLFYVRRVSGQTEIMGYKDPKTGLFVTRLRPDDNKRGLAHNAFRMMARKYAQSQVDVELEKLAALQDVDPETYELKYKPLEVIERELSEYLADAHEFLVDLDKQIAVFRSAARPHTNEYIAYSDDEITEDMYVTEKLDYLNPAKQELTPEQEAAVDKFLDVFVTEDNKRVLAWYFGAMLLNIPIYDERISKMLVVSSAHGGSGKNTLINSLSDALLTDEYRDIKSSFDSFFMTNNRFGASQLLPVRLIQYSEAEFNDMPHGTHNFDGLNISELKSMITEGYISSEKKYEDMQTTRVSSFHIVLTNNPPEIDIDRAALNRRLLALVVNPNSMAEKGVQLGMESEPQVYQYVKDNVQAFANYFVKAFKEDEHAYTTTEYSHLEVAQEIEDGESDRISKVHFENEQLHTLSTHSVYDAIAELARRHGADATTLLHDIRLEKTTPTRDDIRWDDDTLYISGTRSFFAKYKLGAVREELRIVYGDPIKKFHQRMFRLITRK